MRSVFSSIALLISAFLLTATLPQTIDGQSGRGRPRVQPPTSAMPPAPVTIPAAAAVVKQEQSNDVSRFALRNGINVVVAEHHATPIVSVVAYIRLPADSRGEPAGSEDLLQRVILRNSQKPNPIVSARALGGMLDGFVTADASVFFAVAPSSRLNDVVDQQARLLRDPSFDSETIQREAAQKMAELRGTAATPSFRESLLPGCAMISHDLSSAQRSNAIADLGGLTSERLRELYISIYRPENLVVVVVGDVVSYNALIQVQQNYGAFGTELKLPQPDAKVPPDPRATQTKPRIAEPASGPEPQVKTDENKLRYENERGDIGQTIIDIEFRVPGLSSPDWAALEVLSALLGRGRASRLHRSLVDGQMIAAGVESEYFGLSRSGTLFFRVLPAQDSLDRTESAVFRELDRIRHEVPAEGEMVRAKSVLEQRLAERESSYLSRAVELAQWAASAAGAGPITEYKNRIRAVRAADVQQVAAKYLNLQTAFVRELEPFSNPPRTFDTDRFASTVAVWAPGFAAAVEPASVHPADPTQSRAPVMQGAEKSEQQRLAVESMEPQPVKDFSTLNGPRAFVREDHSVPLVTLAFLFQGGRLVETDANSGITELMLRSMMYGTTRRSYSQLNEELEQLGARLEPAVDADFFGFTVSVLSRNSDRVLRILRDIIEEPAFNEDDVRRAILAQSGAIRAERNSGDAGARLLFMSALFPGHPYALPVHGRIETIAKLTPDQLHEWHSRSVKRQHPLVVIVGDTEGSALVSGQLAEGFRRRDLDTSLQVKIAVPAAASEKAEQRSQACTNLVVGTAGPRSNGSDQTALQLIREALNGPGGRLDAELRNTLGVVLSARLSVAAMFSGGAVWIEADATPENEGRAKAALAAELQSLGHNGLSEQELSGARASAAGAHLAVLQSQSARAIEYARAAFYLQSASDVDNLAELASKITIDDIKRVAQTYFKAPSAGILRGRNQSSTVAQPKQD